MFATICIVILFLVAGGAAVTAVVRGDARFVAGIVTAVALVVGLLVTVFSCYDRVDTRNVGIITQFGKPVGEHGAGIVWHAPWQSVSELSEAIQLQAFEGDSFDSHGTAIQVRLANNSNAFVDENLNWRLREGAAPQLFQDYGGSSQDVFANIKGNLVDRQAQVALSKVFSTFNPQLLLANSTVTAPDAVPNPAQGADLPGMAAQVKRDLQDAVGQDIEILDVRIPRLFYDQPTQTKIDAYNQKVQDTLNARQDVKTAEQQRLASEQRAAQAAPDLKVAIFNCVTKATQDGRDAAGCWGQIAGNGGGQSIIQLPKP